MEEINISERLKAVSSYIPSGSKLADIGSDHAYLPCYAVMAGIILGAIAGEVNNGPYQSALKQVRKNNLENKIKVRLGDGLEVITENEVDCITICGMGGPLIKDILENGKQKLKGVKRLILQPNVGAVFVRQWLVENNWELINESILEEDGHIYEIVIAERFEQSLKDSNDDLSLLLGPFLMKEKNEVFQKKWNSEITKWKRVLDELSHAKQDEEVSRKKEEISKKIALVEGVLKS